MPEFNIVFQGCCHGSLDAIYEGIKKLNKKVDLLLIGGDFQAVRDYSDLYSMAVPPKFRQLETSTSTTQAKQRLQFLLSLLVVTMRQAIICRNCITVAGLRQKCLHGC